jgi:septal ring-binding cell division protein DamX
MNEAGSPRPPLPRATPILAVGVAIVLVGGFGLGLYVLRQPGPVLPASTSLSLPPETILPAIEPPRFEPAEPVPPPPVSNPIVPPATPAPVAPEPSAAPAPAISPPPMAAKPVQSAEKPAATPHRRSMKPVVRHSATADRRSVAAPSHKPLPHGRWAIRLGAFQSDDHAKLLIDTLRFHGYSALLIQEHDRNGRGWFVVQTHNYATRTEANAAAKALAEQVHVPTIIFERKADD